MLACDEKVIPITDARKTAFASVYGRNGWFKTKGGRSMRGMKRDSLKRGKQLVVDFRR